MTGGKLGTYNARTVTFLFISLVWGLYVQGSTHRAQTRGDGTCKIM